MDADLPRSTMGHSIFYLQSPLKQQKVLHFGHQIGLNASGFEIKGRTVIRDDQKLTLMTKSQNMVAPWTTRIKLPTT